jgi:hypothetical protein
VPVTSLTCAPAWPKSGFTWGLAPELPWADTLAGFAGGEPVGLGAGLDDVGIEGDTVDDGGDEPGVGEDCPHSLKGRLVASNARISMAACVLVVVVLRSSIRMDVGLDGRIRRAETSLMVAFYSYREIRHGASYRIRVHTALGSWPNVFRNRATMT